MKIVRGNEPAAPVEGKCFLAVGNFDGVHLGHQRVFATAVDRARSRGLAAVLLTFSEHPMRSLRPAEAPLPLMDLEDRLKIAGRFGFQAAVVLDFDREMASMAPDRFVRDVLVGALGAAGIVAGGNWRFGRDRTGDMTFLRQNAIGIPLEVEAVEPVMVEGKPVSSTRIRSDLARGDVAAARSLLGRPHFVRGMVRRGHGRGRALGFPTVNLDVGRIMLPCDGVYAGGFLLAGDAGPAALNVGPSPTFVDNTPGVEAHLLDLNRDLYGESVAIAFVERLRDGTAFPDVETLKNRIAADVNRARELFSLRFLEGIPL